MRERLFRFKQFSISHEAAAMKVGTDGVTIGAWAPCFGRVLDVGCGCGLIGLMAAQRGADEIVMVEIDPDAASEAAANAAHSPWADKVRVECVDFNEFEVDEPFDCIISNPPFFVGGLQSPDLKRASARHESLLAPQAFMRKAASMLKSFLSIIIPPDRSDDWVFAAKLAGLVPVAICELITEKSAVPRRLLFTFAASQSAGAAVERSRLVLNSPEYRALTSPFYL